MASAFVKVVCGSLETLASINSRERSPLIRIKAVHFLLLLILLLVVLLHI